MIPKIIHYCWFGKNPLPPKIKGYIETWRKLCPDYKIKEWNENNFDINSTKWTKEAYAVKKYAFVSDYVRLYALYYEGGIYLDTDIEMIKPFTELLNYHSFIGFDIKGKHLGTATLGSEDHKQWIFEIMQYYKRRSFINYVGKLNVQPNPYIFSLVLSKYNIVYNDQFQILNNKIALFPTEYFTAKDYLTGEIKKTNNTYCIHHFCGSWLNSKNILIKIYHRCINLFIKFKFSI